MSFHILVTFIKRPVQQILSYVFLCLLLGVVGWCDGAG